LRGTIIRRLLLPISHVNRGERRRCPGSHKEPTCESSRDEPSRSVDEFGDRMLGCKSSLPTRTRLWHGPLVEVWLMLGPLGVLCGRTEPGLIVPCRKAASSSRCAKAPPSRTVGGTARSPASSAPKPSASSPRTWAEAVLAVQGRGVLRAGVPGCALEGGRAQGGVTSESYACTQTRVSVV